MCAFRAAVNFGKDIVELSVSTLATLVSVQLADLTAFLKRQSDAFARTGDAHDVAALVILQREYREAFWADRRKTLAETTDALQVASRGVVKSWAEWMRERESSAASIERKPASETSTHDVVAIQPSEVPVANAPEPTKTTRAVTHSKIRGSRRSKAESDAPTKAAVGATRSRAPKRSGKTRHPPPAKH